jgi:hypothetical protein
MPVSRANKHVIGLIERNVKDESISRAKSHAESEALPPSSPLPRVHQTDVRPSLLNGSLVHTTPPSDSTFSNIIGNVFSSVAEWLVWFVWCVWRTGTALCCLVFSFGFVKKNFSSVLTWLCVLQRWRKRPGARRPRPTTRFLLNCRLRSARRQRKEARL